MKITKGLMYLVFVGILIFGGNVLASDADIYRKTVVDAETVAASGTYTSGAVSMQDKRVLGYFSLQVAVTGDGTCKFEALVSINGSDFMEPGTFDDIASSITKTSGPGSDGKAIYKIDLKGIVPLFIKIKVTETGTSDSVTVTADLGYQ